MTYRPVRIDVQPAWPLGYSARILLQDDGIEWPGFGLVRGLDMTQGPYYGWTHRRAWKKAYKAAGGRLFPERPEETP